MQHLQIHCHFKHVFFSQLMTHHVQYCLMMCQSISF